MENFNFIENIEIHNLPQIPGVYFFYNDKNDLVYIGKSINIYKRVQQHFKGKDRKSIKIQNQVKYIRFEETGSELIALLHESELIKIHKPIFNRAQRKTHLYYGLYLKNVDGYLGLHIQKITDDKDVITTFSSLNEAKETLFKITEYYFLCQKINNLYQTNSACFGYQVKMCFGACVQKEKPELYNKRVMKFIENNVLEKFTKFFVLPGRNPKEIGIVYIENGTYKGFGFCKARTRKENYIKHIQPKQDNKDARRILIRYIIQQKMT